jgi:hypothetical protein
VTLQSAIELVLSIGAILLLARDMHRAWLDQLRRPVTLLWGTLIAALLIGARPHPSSWWLVLPAMILVWEVVRGWRRAPRSHHWEAGVGAFAVSLLLALVGLTPAEGSLQSALLAAAAGAAVVGAGLLFRSRRHEPPPWRPGDVGHYERRQAGRGHA